eukprot:TRINITY_DN6929_c0_g1_i1.p1 TRINITY_DN6929_c0_g1~~TRINITY_DN6929_c0_g1_i1.p1  ORF type:complete len:209 (+),score=73.22 TRINITY_DN6929_c0_g1_i1:38-664(+)
MVGKVVEYCPVCTFPFEYCEFSTQYEKCKLVPNRPDSAPAVDDDEDVKADAPAVNEKKPPVSAAVAGDSDDDLNVDDLVNDLDDPQPAESKSASAVSGGAGKKKKGAAVPGEVLIYRVSRTKKKNVTYVKGLEAHDDKVKTKDAVKTFKTKFACGAALQKSEDGLEEMIVVQGDVQVEMAEFLVKKYKIPEEVIFLYDPKTKSKTPAF